VIGGDRLVWFDRDNAEASLWDGLLLTAEVRMRRGRRNRCHGNSATLWRKDTERRQIGTGYALSDDDIWRQHSWVLEGQRFYETTVRRECSFGVVLSPEDSLYFFLSTLIAEEYPDFSTIPAGFFDPYPDVRALIKEARKPRFRKPHQRWSAVEGGAEMSCFSAPAELSGSPSREPTWAMKSRQQLVSLVSS